MDRGELNSCKQIFRERIYAFLYVCMYIVRERERERERELLKEFKDF
jgi:hypothetical protein